MEKNISKKLLAGVCALSAGFILAACNPITAVPTNYDEPIVYNKDGSPTVGDDNKLGKIYDAVATDRNTKIVSDLLEEVALGRFGTYSEIEAANASDDAKIEYVNKYSKVFHRDGDSKVEGEDERSVRIDRFDTFYKDIKSRISEFFYNEITSGSYNDEEGRFDESKLWMAHYYEFYDLKDPDGATFKSYFVTNKLTKENAFSDEFLNTVFYSNSEEGKRGYIEEKVFPQILKDKLVEEYVYNNNYSSLGRAYARKVNYIKVSYESDIVSWKLLKKFANDYIENVPGSTDVNFEIIAKALKGFDDVGSFEEDEVFTGVVPLSDPNASEEGQAAKALLDDVVDTTNVVVVDGSEAHLKHYTLNEVQLIQPGTYYKDTKLGELLDSYEKAIRAEESGRFPIASEKAELDKFTSSGKSKAYGLREKLISLAKEDYTTDGWFVKNGGLSELPSALRDRLFNINVANVSDDISKLKYEDATVDKGAKKEIEAGVYHYSIGSYETDANGNALKRLPYIRNINGNKFVIPAKSQTWAEDPYNYLYQDVDGKAFYIVQVLEAPSTPKLNTTADHDTYRQLYETKGDFFKTEEVARAVAKVLGTKDSYIKDAYTEILSKFKDTFVFYETSLYEHFKSEYPDLFDNED